jgi:hypothetical protein
MLADNLSRQLDELTVMESMYDVSVEIDDGDLDAIRAAASGEAAEANAQLQYRVRVPLEVDGCSASLLVVLPHGYPATSALEVSCSLELRAGGGRKLDEQVSALLSERCAQSGVGAEAVMDAVMWLAEEGGRRASEAASAQAATEAPAPNEEWRRVFYWIDHMAEGRQHKKEAEVVELARSLRLTGALYFGRPGILIAEGLQTSQDELVREARKAGKTLKPKKSQKLACASDARYSDFATVSLSGEGLDVDALRVELVELGLEHKYKFILGLEDLP